MTDDRDPSLTDPQPLPRGLDDIDAAFMTQVLRRSGVISQTNEVVSQVETGVGMTAGYFSSIKKVRCAYRDPTDAPTQFVAKAWPSLELASKDSIAGMFIKDIKGYQVSEDRFYPRPKTHLAAYDADDGRYGLIMEDANAYAEHKVHESELTFDEVMRMIPRLVDVAIAWEGADQGAKAAELAEMGVGLWTAPENIAGFKEKMPGGAPFWDVITARTDSSLITGEPWPQRLGVPDFSRMMTTRLDGFFEAARPDHGATCTLAHGDLRGDNIFFCEDLPDYPHGWLCIDYQLMFRGPVPSDLAYLMNSGSVLPEVYAAESQAKIQHVFFDQFMARTRRYPDYSFERFADEYRMMATLQYLNYVGYGAPIAQAGAFNNDLGARIELGGKGATEADLPPEEIRQRMWWKKALANFAESFSALGLVERLRAVPEDLDGLGPWVELPEHLR
ncbi:MAG TPA: hypothetical protein VHW60_08400 [Caulobacteraceae bacterium]|jgi:hypothetical protein|nr:hypothetical protein [Caulobacteraceae bacterium]